LPGDGAVAPTAAGHVVTPIKLRLRSRPDLYAEDVRVLDVGDCRYSADRQGSARELPVLLRHRLLRKPSGFEGLSGVREALPVDDLRRRRARPTTGDERSVELAPRWKQASCHLDVLPRHRLRSISCPGTSARERRDFCLHAKAEASDRVAIIQPWQQHQRSSGERSRSRSSGTWTVVIGRAYWWHGWGRWSRRSAWSGSTKAPRHPRSGRPWSTWPASASYSPASYQYRASRRKLPNPPRGLAGAEGSAWVYFCFSRKAEARGVPWPPYGEGTDHRDVGHWEVSDARRTGRGRGGRDGVGRGA